MDVRLDVMREARQHPLSWNATNYAKRRFRSARTQPATAGLRAVLGNASALYALDPELAPFHCPRCNAAYCGEHWRTYGVFEDGLHDSIRGARPLGHDRILED